MPETLPPPSAPPSAPRSRSVDRLEKAKAMPLVVERALDDAITLRVSVDHNAVVTQADGLKDTTMAAGERRVLYLAPPAAKDLPKDAKPGATLTGTINYGKTTTGSMGPATFPLVVLVPPEEPKEKGGKGDAAADGDAAAAEQPAWSEQLAEAVRDAKVKFLKDLKTGDDKEWAAYADARAAVADGSDLSKHLPYLQARYVFHGARSRSACERRDCDLTELRGPMDSGGHIPFVFALMRSRPVCASASRSQEYLNRVAAPGNRKTRLKEVVAAADDVIGAGLWSVWE